MRIPFIAVVALGVVACATGQQAGMPQSSVYCDPCPLPCVHDPTCSAWAVAQPAPAPVTAPYAIEPPPAQPSRVVVTEEKIELKERVFFDTGETTIKPESDSLLDEVADVLNAHPEVERVVVEGHTDDRGAVDFNDRLSQGRADAVRTHLVGHGVDGARLEARGFGSSRPIADNRTAEGRDANRRVEFVVTH